MLKVCLLAFNYFISSFLLAFNNLQVARTIIAFLLLLPLFLEAIQLLTSSLLSLILLKVVLLLINKGASFVSPSAITLMLALILLLPLKASSFSLSFKPFLNPPLNPPLNLPLYPYLQHLQPQVELALSKPLFPKYNTRHICLNTCLKGNLYLITCL